MSDIMKYINDEQQYQDVFSDINENFANLENGPLFLRMKECGLITNEDMVKFLSGEEIELTFTSDFMNKVSGSKVENANTASFRASTSLVNPKDFIDDAYIDYSKLCSLDGTAIRLSNSQNNQMAQGCIKYDFIDIINKVIGDKFWEAQNLITLTDKVNFLTQRFALIEGAVYGFGNSPTGNKLSLYRALNSSKVFSSWEFSTATTNNFITEQTATLTTPSQFSTALDGNGLFSLLAISDPSNVTVASSVTLDYTSVSFKIKVSLSDFVVPRKEFNEHTRTEPERVLDTISGKEKHTTHDELSVDGNYVTGSRYVKDLPQNEIISPLPNKLPYHYNGLTWVDGLSYTMTEDSVRFTVTKIGSTCYRPYSLTRAVLKQDTDFTLAFDYKIKDGVNLLLHGNAINKNYYSGSGRAVINMSTPVFTSGYDYLSFDACKWDGKASTPAAIGDWFELSNIILVEGTFDKLPYHPAPENVGVVHGQPNLLSGTSNEWKAYTFTGWNPEGVTKINLTDVGLKVGDSIAYMSEIDNTANTNGSAYSKLSFSTGSSTISELGTNKVVAGESGISQVSAVIPEGTTTLLWYSVGKNNNTSESTVKVRGHKLIKGSLEAMDEWTPTQAEFEGKPNLLDGTSDQWVEETFSSYDSSIFPVVPLSTSGLKIGDTLSLSVEIDNTKSIFKSRSFISYYNSSGSRLVTHSTGLVDEGKVGVATVTSVIPEGAVSVFVSRVSKHSTGTSTVSTRKHKLIKGTIAELGIWVPKDRTEYDKNLGIVPFTEADYNTLQTADEIVRAETKVVGRGAEIEFKFDVIGTLEKKYPYLFEGITTMDEKIEKYKSKLKQFRITHTSRGGGISTTTGNVVNRSRMRIKTGSITWGGIGDANITDRFISVTTPWIEPYRNIMNDDGTITTAVVSKNNNVVEAGVVSDGVTPAWVEVRDIKLIVEMTINGRTVVEEIAADVTDRKRVEDIATKELADALSDEQIKAFLDYKDITFIVETDFNNKMPANYATNGNYSSVGLRNQPPSTLRPTMGTEENLPNYQALYADDGNIRSGDNLGEDTYRYHNFIFDTSRAAEDKLGDNFWNKVGCVTMKQKVAFLKARVQYINYMIEGYGKGASGNKLTYCIWDAKHEEFIIPLSNTSSTPSKIENYLSGDMSALFNENAQVSFVAYSEPSDNSVSTVTGIDYLNFGFNLPVNRRDFSNDANALQKISDLENHVVTIDGDIAQLKVADIQLSNFIGALRTDFTAMKNDAVTLTTGQTITGQKAFTKRPVIDGSSAVIQKDSATADEILLGEANDKFVSPAMLKEATKGNRAPFIEYFGIGSPTNDLVGVEYSQLKIGSSMGTPNGIANRPYTINADGTLTVTRNFRGKVDMSVKVVAGNTSPSDYLYIYIVDVNTNKDLAGDDFEIISFGSTRVSSNATVGNLNYNWISSGTVVLDFKAGWIIKPTLRIQASRNLRWGQVESLTVTEIVPDNEKIKIDNLENNPIMRYNDVEAYFNNKYKMASKNLYTSDLVNGSSNASVSELAGIIRRVGNEVRVYLRINVRGANGQNEILKIPNGFKLSSEYSQAKSKVWNVPLTITQYQNYADNDPRAGSFIEQSSNTLRASTNLAGNWYLSGYWITEDPFPNEYSDGVILSYGNTTADFETDPFLRESEVEAKLANLRCNRGKQTVFGENRQVTDPSSVNFGDFYISDSESDYSSLPSGVKYFTIDSSGVATVERDGRYVVSGVVKRQFRTSVSLWHYVSLVVKKVDDGSLSSLDFSPVGGSFQNRSRSLAQVTGRFKKGDKIWFKSESNNTTNALQFLNIDQFTMERLSD